MKMETLTIDNLKCIKHAEIPLFRQINQVYVPDKGDMWDLEMTADILFRAIKKGWTKNLSNVVTDRMDSTSRITLIIEDEDNLCSYDGAIIPTYYKVTLRKKTDERWDTDIAIEYFYSLSGSLESAIWHELDDERIIRKIKRMCEETIMDKEGHTDAIHVDPFLLDYILTSSAEKQRKSFVHLLPWMLLDDRSNVDGLIIMVDPYRDVDKNLAQLFNVYLDNGCEGHHILFITDKREELIMSCRTTVIHKGQSFEFPHEHHANIKERKEAYELYINTIVQKG